MEYTLILYIYTLYILVCDKMLEFYDNLDFTFKYRTLKIF